MLAVALAAPTVGYQLWASAQTRERAIARAVTRAEELASLAAAQENDSLAEASNLTRVLTRVPVIVNASQGECHQLLRDITNEHPRVDLIAVERADGSVACTSAQPIPPTYNLADRAWFQEATAPDAPATVVSDLLISRAKGYLGVIVASGLRQPGSTESQGAISALMKLSWFSDIATKLSESTGASVQIVDVRSGSIIAHSASSSQVTGDQLSPRLIAAMRTSPGGTIETADDGGQTEIVAFRWLPSDQGLHSTVLVRMRKSAVLEYANQQLVLGLLTTGAVLLAGILVAWCVAEISIVRPLSVLAGMALRLSGGDLEARVALQTLGVSELRVLGETLNRAVEQIQARDSKLEQMTLSDPLTGLANRRCFDRALEREWFRAGRSGGSLAVLMVDVDYFKLFNDSYGHLAGDDCLRRIAQAVAGEARSTLDVTARFGGEEIALLAPNIDPAKALELAERVVAAVRRLELTHAASPLHWVTVSVGLAVGAPGELGEAPETLIQAADQALYEAKRSGRNRAASARSKERALDMAWCPAVNDG